MEIGARIKGHRSELGLSQDDLAARIYVSRQTISSWENDRTYPDVQSLLLLSEVFGTTIDSLVKGDLEAMDKLIERDARTFLNLGFAIIGFLALMLAALVWMAVQLIAWDWSWFEALPTFVLAVVLWSIAFAASAWADHIKKEHDLVTYWEVRAFLEGKPIDRTSERGRRLRAIPRWMKAVRIVGLVLLAAAIGWFVGYNLGGLVNFIAG